MVELTIKQQIISHCTCCLASTCGCCGLILGHTQKLTKPGPTRGPGLLSSKMGRLRVTMACLLFTLLLIEMSSGAQETVMSTIPVFPQIPSHQEWDDFQVLVSIEAPKPVHRVPIHLTVVHSISNDNVLNEVKKAMKFISMQLLVGTTGNENLLTIVGPSKSGDRVLIMPKDQREAMKEIESMAHTDGTTLKTFLEMAIETLKNESSGQGHQHAGAIILLTDGESLGDHVNLVQGNADYPVHTFGLGAKHDHKALRRIASASIGGAYSFVDDENEKMISAALAVCVGGLKNVVVPATSVLKLEAVGRVNITRIRYGQYNSPTKPAGDEEIKIGMLHAGETKKIIVHLEVPREDDERRVGGGCGERTLLTASFFGNTGDDAAPTTAVCVERRPPGVPAVQTAPSPLVLQEVARYNLLDVVHKISSATTSSIATVLKEELDVFVQTHQFWSGIDVVLGGLQKELLHVFVQTHQPRSASWAAAYIGSWMSSYETQRPTAMGSPSNVVSAFLTQEVSTMLVEVVTLISNNVVFFPGRHDCAPCPTEPGCLNAQELVEIIHKALKERNCWTLCSQLDAGGDDRALPEA
ncbi:hypothetical protein ACP4OV_026828 [Aristida adscensionis]